MKMFITFFFILDKQNQSIMQIMMNLFNKGAWIIKNKLAHITKMLMSFHGLDKVQHFIKVD